MSWKQAQAEAARWIDRLQLKTDEIKGTTIDLRPYAHMVQQEGQFRTMVFRAAARILKSRGADSILPE